ncbi:hypothetical protein J7J37_00960 [bacterium]|nr:hypothetical protein [bacterium]
MLVRKEDIIWTKHSQEKLREYNLSKSRIVRVLRNPQRVEEGIAPRTLALMQPAGSKKHPYEIWLMAQIIFPKRKKIKEIDRIDKRYKVRIISAWKYPGQTPIGKPIKIPEDALEELTKFSL